MSFVTEDCAGWRADRN